MQILLKKVTIVDPSSTHHGKVLDVLVRKNKIEDIRKNISADGAKVIDVKGACLSPGWLDIGTLVGEPGFEHRETLESASRAALAGGYTAIAPFPNTHPVIDSSALIAFWKNESNSLPINIHPIGSVSQGNKGKDIAELHDMHQAGAVAFSDGNHSIDEEGLLLRALQYAQRFNGLVIDQPQNMALVKGAQVHEGKASTMMGMKGNPSNAEFSRVKRNLDVLTYTNGRLCLHMLSTSESVDEVKSVRKKGHQVSATVGVHNLCFTEEDVLSFDHNLKTNPPLRSERDRKALIKGLKKGNISIIVSQHTPLEEELKERAFFDSLPGAISLQTTFPMLSTHLKGELETETIVKALCHNPRSLLGIDLPRIASGEIAEMTLFHTDLSWTFESTNNYSRSKNSSSFGQTFTGCVLATFAKGRMYTNIEI